MLILHIVGTDKVSHEYSVRGPIYREKYREVDDFVREVAGRLAPEDYLYAISDHGHNEMGGHTEDAAYLVRGPLFPSGVRQDLHGEDMLFLLSLPYGLTLPAGYEGQIRMDLTRLAPDAAERWLAAQAGIWRVPIAGLPLDTAQARLNEFIARQRTKGQRVAVLDALWHSLPFWLAAALFLIGELPMKYRAEGNGECSRCRSRYSLSVWRSSQWDSRGLAGSLRFPCSFAVWSGSVGRCRWL